MYIDLRDRRPGGIGSEEGSERVCPQCNSSSIVITGHPLQVPLLGRFHVGHSLVLDKLSCISSTHATDELNSVQFRVANASSHFSYTHMPSKACETLLYPAVPHILRIFRLPGECHNVGDMSSIMDLPIHLSRAHEKRQQQQWNSLTNCIQPFYAR